MAVFTLLRGVLLAGLIPPLQGPDEPAHWNYAQRVAEHGRLPVPEVHCPAGRDYSPEGRTATLTWQAALAFHPERPVPPLERVALPDPADPSRRSTSGCGPAATYPPAYYVSLAAAYATASGGTFYERLFAARLVSVLWGVLAVLAAFALGVFVLGGTWDGVLMGLLMATQPMVLFLTSVLNNDAALFACTATALAAIAAARQVRWRLPALLVLAAAATVGSLTKNTFYLLLPLLFVGCAFALGPRRVGSWLRTAAVFALPLLVATAWSTLWPAGRGGLVGQSGTPLTVSEFLSRWVFDAERFRTLWVHMYWMTWGWVDTNLPRAYFDLLLGMMALAAVGLVLGWRRASVEERWLILLGTGATLGMMTLLYVLELLHFRALGMALIQGRYLLPLFPVHALMLVLGLRWLGRALRVRVDLPWAMVATLAVVNAAAVVLVIHRYYA